MKNITNRLILIAATTLALSACGEDANTIEAKKKQLEKHKEELVTLKSQIEKLENELAKETSVDEKANLRRVTTLKVLKSAFAHFVEVPGDVSSDQNVMVAPEMSGVVVKTYVEEGDYVTRGQKIAALDVEVIKKQIEEVKTGLSLAQTLYEKQERIWKQNIGSEVQYLQAKNNVESLTKKLESLNTQLSKGVVVAPISGTIDEIFPNKGEMAPVGQPLARIMNLNIVDISAEVSEAYSRSLEKGDTVLVKFPMLEMEKELIIDNIGQYINPKNRTFKILMKMDNRKEHLKPNTMAMVKIKDYATTDVISVPTNLVQHSTDGTTFMYVVEPKGGKDIVKKVSVKTGRSYAGYTMIESGLNDGVTIVNKGYSEVINGEEVNVVKDNTNTVAVN